MLKSLPQNTRSEFFAALEGVKQEVESAAKVTATKSHNASAIIFASISEAVEEKLDALNETLGAMLIRRPQSFRIFTCGEATQVNG